MNLNNKDKKKSTNNLEKKIKNIDQKMYNLTHYSNDSIKLIALYEIASNNYILGIPTFIAGLYFDMKPENARKKIPSFGRNIKPNKYITYKLRAYKQAYNILKKPFNI